MEGLDNVNVERVAYAASNVVVYVVGNTDDDGSRIEVGNEDLDHPAANLVDVEYVSNNYNLEKIEARRKVGNSSDVVYVLSFCRGDSSNNSCFKCLSSAAEDLMIKCPNQKVAVTWGTGEPPCIIIYADGPMYGKKMTFPTLKSPNVDNITMDQNQFDPIWRNFTEELATSTSMGTSELKFAAGRTVLPNFQTMFVLSQCSPDLSQIDCQSCLWEF
ncbi:cysteine-rich receptor-like protein kinase 14 [Eucalyptus grandis]|uniref:cysteine-rich receptor-like protein kinase 14 n=1 Tax=Eucalyptus grandis TaxID=71139 RepID=UPI00192EF381|nr:cysteine-rich receptor-like protein kinase 14 [Eucalyptus grandis]